MKKIIILAFILLVSCSSFMPQDELLPTKTESSHGPSMHIIIPAYNEEHRIAKMLSDYCTYFSQFNIHFTVVLNGITDNTLAVVQQQQELYPNTITIIESAKGKGNAIKAGFLHALTIHADYIGFVDADGATSPDQYYKLLCELIAQQCDGVIASRYMKDSDLGAPRPLIKRWGRKLFYNRRIEKKLKLYYEDYQCGAKLFKRSVIALIAPNITESGWAIDLDLLYLCKHYDFHIKEIPIRWRDAPGSHLSILSSARDLYYAVDRIKHKTIISYA